MSTFTLVLGLISFLFVSLPAVVQATPVAIERVELSHAMGVLPRVVGSDWLTMSSTPLWPIDHLWTEADEADYALWVKANVGADFLKGTGLVVDCADLAMSIRWVYARAHHLPAADTLPGGTLFGSWQSTTAWDRLPSASDWRRDERFKAALKYLMQFAYSHSVLNDTYPVAVQPKYVDAGTILLTVWDNSGFTRTLTGVSTCLGTAYGGEPATSTVNLGCETPAYQASGAGGLLRWRWPEMDASGKWSLRAGVDMRGYSLEQFEWTPDQYVANVNARLHMASPFLARD